MKMNELACALTLALALASATAVASSLDVHQSCGDPPPTSTKINPVPGPDGIIDLQNDKCPIMGGEVEKGVFLDYEGVRIHLCCPGCDKQFLKDPEKFLKVLGIDDLARFKKERGNAK